MSVKIEGRAKELLKAKNFCHVSTLRSDGSVHGGRCGWTSRTAARRSTRPKGARGRATSSAIRG